jgi:hypothetical protein
MRIQVLMVSAVLTLLAACAAPTTAYAPKVTEFSRPALNTVTSVTIGDSLLSQGNLSEQNGIQVAGPVDVSLYTLSGGFYPQTGSDNNGTFHSFAGADGRGELGGVRKAWLADPAKSLVTRGEGTLCVVTVLNVAACGAPSGGVK